MKIINCLFVFCFSMAAHGTTPCSTITNAIPELDKVYKSGKFRFYYTSDTKNLDYIPDQTDINKNNIPDYVENMAIQANATADALNLLGLTNPLDSDRFKGSVDYIDFHISALSGNGVALETPYKYPNMPLKEGKCSLVIKIRNNIEGFPGNYWTTVNHELFHLYHYGYTQFKDSWFHEGINRQMERLLKSGAIEGNGLTLLPQDTTTLTSLYENSSQYNPFWNRLAFLSDSSDGQLNLPASLLNGSYIDGSKVFKDEKLKGFIFNKKFLENMKISSDSLSYEKGWDKHNWTEENQTSIANRPYILKAIQDTMLQLGINQSNEEKVFINLK